MSSQDDNFVFKKIYYSGLYDVLAIGASTGGPGALKEILSKLPTDFPLSVVVVQHMMSDYIQHLVTWLNGFCELPVYEAKSGESLKRGSICISPEDQHLTITHEKKIVLSKDPYEASYRPSIDILMHSVAHVFGQRSLGMLLTGIGGDGVEGLGAIRKAGGVTYAQGEESSIIFDLPKRAIVKGYAQHVLELSELSGHVMEIV